MRFYGQWNPPVDEVLYRNYFIGCHDGVFVECGAGNGVTDSCCYAFEEAGWTGVNLEPCPDVFKALARNRPTARNLNEGLSDREGETEYTIVTAGGQHIGGVTEQWHPKWRAENVAKGHRFHTTRIKIRTFGSLGLERVTLLALDVDGHELAVIRGMEGAVRPDVICVEYTMVGLETLQQMLGAQGYRYDFLSFNNAFFSRHHPVRKAWFGETPRWRW